MLLKQLKISILAVIVWTVITGVIYPLVITGIAQAIFPHEANGSLIRRDGKVVGSSLIGQSFDDPKYFRGRPSATAPLPYDAAASSGSNLGPLHPALKDAIRARVDALRAADPANTARIPIDLVTASGSGLDPHISPAAALYQLDRVAKARGWNEAKRAEVRALIGRMTEPALAGMIGEPHVNVLLLNLAIDAR